MGKSINYLLSLLVSVIVIVFLMKWLGVTMNDVETFITQGIGGAIKVFQMFREALFRPIL